MEIFISRWQIRVWMLLLLHLHTTFKTHSFLLLGQKIRFVGVIKRLIKVMYCSDTVKSMKTCVAFMIHTNVIFLFVMVTHLQHAHVYDGERNNQSYMGLWSPYPSIFACTWRGLDNLHSKFPKNLRWDVISDCWTNQCLQTCSLSLMNRREWKLSVFVLHLLNCTLWVSSQPG